MSIIEIFILGVGLSMDAFAVSICKGLSMGRVSLKCILVCGLWFGGFQAIMPLAGFYLGNTFSGMIQAADHWVAFVLLCGIGLNMMKEAFKGEGENCCGEINLSVKEMFLLATATSIDALAVGISLALAGNIRIYAAVGTIGITTAIISAVGVCIGALFGSKFEKKAQIAGGVILIAIAFRILITHLTE